MTYEWAKGVNNFWKKGNVKTTTIILYLQYSFYLYCFNMLIVMSSYKKKIPWLKYQHSSTKRIIVTERVILLLLKNNWMSWNTEEYKKLELYWHFGMWAGTITCYERIHFYYQQKEASQYYYFLLFNVAVKERHVSRRNDWLPKNGWYVICFMWVIRKHSFLSDYFCSIEICFDTSSQRCDSRFWFTTTT